MSDIFKQCNPCLLFVSSTWISTATPHSWKYPHSVMRNWRSGEPDKALYENFHNRSNNNTVCLSCLASVYGNQKTFLITTNFHSNTGSNQGSRFTVRWRYSISNITLWSRFLKICLKNCLLCYFNPSVSQIHFISHEILLCLFYFFLFESLPERAIKRSQMPFSQNGILCIVLWTAQGAFFGEKWDHDTWVNGRRKAGHDWRRLPKHRCQAVRADQQSKTSVREKPSVPQSMSTGLLMAPNQDIFTHSLTRFLRKLFLENHLSILPVLLGILFYLYLQNMLIVMSYAHLKSLISPPFWFTIFSNNFATSLNITKLWFFLVFFISCHCYSFCMLLVQGL